MNHHNIIVELLSVNKQTYHSNLSTPNDDYQNSQICIVTGPNINIAIKLIKRMKALFEPKLGVIFDTKETVWLSIKPFR